MLPAESLSARADDAPPAREPAAPARPDLVGIASEFEGPGAIRAIASSSLVGLLFWTALFGWLL